MLKFCIQRVAYKTLSAAKFSLHTKRCTLHIESTIQSTAIMSWQQQHYSSKKTENWLRNYPRTTGVQSAVRRVQCKVFSVQCEVCTLQCAVCSV